MTVGELIQELSIWHPDTEIKLYHSVSSNVPLVVYSEDDNTVYISER